MQELSRLKLIAYYCLENVFTLIINILYIKTKSRIVEFFFPYLFQSLKAKELKKKKKTQLKVQNKMKV